MHTDHDSIVLNTRALKEAHQKPERSGIPITDATLVIIAMKSMLVTHKFPTTINKWVELGKSTQTWGKWKGLYKKADKQARVNRQAAGGRDHF